MAIATAPSAHVRQGAIRLRETRHPFRKIGYSMLHGEMSEVFETPSETQPGITYTVQYSVTGETACDCPAGSHGHPCKHSWRISEIERASEAHMREMAWAEGLS